MEISDLKRLLVVDDEEIFRNLLEKTLTLEGYTVETARDGAEAIALVLERKYGVILTDLMMPRAGGIEVLQTAKQADPQAAVIIITGYASLDSALAAIKEGAYDYITKPFQLEEIKLTVSNAYQMKRLMLENVQLMEGLQKAYQQISELLEGKSEYSDKIRDINAELDRRQKEIFDGVQALKKTPIRNVRSEPAQAALSSVLNFQRFQETSNALERKRLSSARDSKEIKKQLLDF